jgi:hypothetical protein
MEELVGPETGAEITVISGGDAPVERYGSAAVGVP